MEAGREENIPGEMKNLKKELLGASLHRAGSRLFKEDMCAQFNKNKNVPHGFVEPPCDIVPGEWGTQ